MATASCSALTEQNLISETGRIASDFSRIYVPRSPWSQLSFNNTAQWDNGMGDELSVLVHERSFAANKSTWQSITADPDGTEAVDSICNIPAQRVSAAMTLKQYGLKGTSLESDDFCLENLRFPWKASEQIKATVSNLMENTYLTWVERFQDEYLKIAQKVIVNDSLDTFTQEAIPGVEATGRLNQEVLDYLYEDEVFNGGQTNAYGMSEGGPVFALLLDSFTSRDIIKKDEAVRQDFRWAAPSELLKPLGVKRSYSGFFHLSDLLTPRADFINGAYVFYRPYKPIAATTRGIRWEKNPDWEAAEFTVSFIYHPDALDNIMPKMPQVGNGMQFQNQNYTGDFQWKNIPDRECNPDGNIGFWRAKFFHGTKPLNTRLAKAIIHKRCVRDFGLTGCTSSQ